LLQSACQALTVYVPTFAVFSEMTCTFDLTKVIMIYSGTKTRYTTSYSTQLPVQEQEVQFQISFGNVGYKIISNYVT